MEIVQRGIHFIAKGSNDHSTEIKFCHKDKDGKFVDGLTNEEMVDVMISRFMFLTEKNGSEQNIQCLLFARQIKGQLQLRNQNKIKRRQHDNSGNGISLQVAS